MRKYTETHEWIEIEGETATVGITQYAQKELGEIVYVELPKVGRQVSANSEAAVLESTKAAADVYSPATGQILEVNSQLSQATDLINHSPEKEGWLFKLKLNNAQELSQLMDNDGYQQMLKRK